MKRINSMLLVVVIIFTSFQLIATPQIAFAINDAPSYAKWGREAMIIAKEKYPSADIIDYQHIGKDVKQRTEVEKFKLWMRQQDKEFGVFIFIEYTKNTQKIVSIRTIKTER